MADDDDDMLFSSALPVEAFGVYSGETELELEGLVPAAAVRLTQDFDVQQSSLLWNAAVGLAQRWHEQHSALPAVGGLRVLELGAGLGLNSICLAAQGATVVATEVEPALSALRRSVARNCACWEGRGVVIVEELRWDGEEEWPASVAGGGPFDVVVGADLLYSRALRPPLLSTLRRVPMRHETAVVLAYEARGDEARSCLGVGGTRGCETQCTLVGGHAVIQRVCCCR